MDKSIEYWAAILGMAIYTAVLRAETAPIKHRIAKTASSGFLTFALSPWVSEVTGFSEVAVAIAIMALGLTLLDVAIAIVSDETFIKDIVRSMVSKGKR